MFKSCWERQLKGRQAMIDSHFRTPWQTYIFDPLATLLAKRGVSALQLTVLALILGLCCPLALIAHERWLAVFLLLLSGICDVLDGSVARIKNSASNQGAILDIVSDRIVEACVVLGLYLYDPEPRAFAALFLLSSFYICVSTFLLSGIFTKNSSAKSFHYSPGLIERSETFIFFPLVIIFDQFFNWAAIAFALLIYLTAFVRLRELLKLH